MAKVLKRVPASKVKVFKIANRRGYAAVCLNNLTEGSSAYLAYLRLIKALKRNGFALEALDADKIKRVIVAHI